MPKSPLNVPAPALDLDPATSARRLAATMSVVLAAAACFVAVFTAAWLDQLGPLSHYLTGRVPAGQAAYAASRWMALLALLLLWVQLMLAVALRGAGDTDVPARRRLVDMHQALGIFALLALALHPAFYLLGVFQRSGVVRWDYLGLRTQDFYATAMSVGAVALYLVAVGSLAAFLRRVPALQGVWKRIHRVNVPVFLLAAAHGLLIGSETRLVAVLLLLLLAGASLTAFFGMTERQRVERSLSLFRSLVDASQEPIAVFSPQGLPMYANAACRSWLRSQPGGEAELHRLLAGGRWEGVVGLPGPGGEVRNLWLRRDEVRDGSGRLLFTFGMLHDVSDRVRAEEAVRQARDELEVRVREATARLQVAREEERARIARELHDELGQYLTVLAIDLSWLEERLPSRKQALLERVEAMAALVETTLQTVRRMARELLPRAVEDLGLAAAVESEARQLCERAGLRFQFHADLDGVSLDKACSIALFRICQEALTNVVRHAGATKVEIRLDAEGERLRLEIRDDGRGLEPGAPPGSGLAGMRERALPWDGQVEILGSPDQGTRVSVVLPLERCRAGAVEPVGP